MSVTSGNDRVCCTGLWATNVNHPGQLVWLNSQQRSDQMFELHPANHNTNGGLPRFTQTVQPCISYLHLPIKQKIIGHMTEMSLCNCTVESQPES